MRSLAIRVAAPIVFAATMLAAPVAGDPPAAVAAPEWDVGAYDACMAREQEMAGDIPGYPGGSQAIRWCCEKSGGIYDPDRGTLGTCGAPPAVAADEPTKPPAGPRAPTIPGPAPFVPVG